MASFPKPETDWIVTDDGTLRIVPARLWERVQARLAEVRTTRPGGAGKRGFEGQCGGRVQHYPSDLLSGSMVCGSCGSSVVKVSRSNGGDYGSLGAAVL